MSHQLQYHIKHETLHLCHLWTMYNHFNVQILDKFHFDQNSLRNIWLKPTIQDPSMYFTEQVLSTRFNDFGTTLYFLMEVTKLTAVCSRLLLFSNRLIQTLWYFYNFCTIKCPHRQFLRNNIIIWDSIL